MAMRVSITAVSRNKKTGPILTTMSSPSTCPDRCSLKGKGCYAEHGPVNIHWKQVDKRGLEWEDFVVELPRKLRGHTLWRHNVAGDLPVGPDGVNVDWAKVLTMASQAYGVSGFTYTHHPATPENLRAFTALQESYGFVTNLSADSLDEADRYFATGLPVVVTVPSDWTGIRYTNAGNPVVVCPAAISEQVTCQTCRLCANAGRKSIVGFPAHGARKRVINLRLEAANA